MLHTVLAWWIGTESNGHQLTRSSVLFSSVLLFFSSVLLFFCSSVLLFLFSSFSSLFFCAVSSSGVQRLNKDMLRLFSCSALLDFVVHTAVALLLRFFLYNTDRYFYTAHVVEGRRWDSYSSHTLWLFVSFCFLLFRFCITPNVLSSTDSTIVFPTGSWISDWNLCNVLLPCLFAVELTAAVSSFVLQFNLYGTDDLDDGTDEDDDHPYVQRCCCCCCCANISLLF